MNNNIDYFLYDQQLTFVLWASMIAIHELSVSQNHIHIVAFAQQALLATAMFVKVS